MKAPNLFVEAVLDAKFDVAKQLLDSGIDINARYGNTGWTALHFSAEQLLEESVRWLLENRADPNRADTSGWTSLHLSVDAESDFAARKWDVAGARPPAAKLVTLLLQHGADPNVRAHDGRNPLAIARSYRNTEAIAELMRYGAKELDSA